MIINCNIDSTDRKQLTQVLGEILSVKPVYLKAPTYAYQIGSYTVDREGKIICPASASAEDVEDIASKLTEAGLNPEIEDDAPVAKEVSTLSTTDEAPEAENPLEEAPVETPAESPAAAPESADAAQSDTEAESPANGQETPDVAAPEADIHAETEEVEPKAENAEGGTEVTTDSDEDETRLTISVPRSKVPDDVLIRLQAIVLNKKVLFQRALQIESLPIEVTDDAVSFPWFTLTGMDGEAEAYAQFITHLVKMADEQSRVLDKPYDGDNDKFAMRIFMVRMGMKGVQFALARKLMMQHLTGNSGWRFGAPPKKPEEPEAPAEALETPEESAESPIEGEPAEEPDQEVTTHEE